MFAPFFKDIFNTTDALLYVDADVIFLGDVEPLWEKFKLFDQKQFAAMAPEHEDEKVAWYPTEAKFPFYGKFGLNSGVMLMNLTRLRKFKMSKKMVPIYQQYKNDIKFGDQCLLNIFFHKYPSRQPKANASLKHF